MELVWSQNTALNMRQCLEDMTYAQTVLRTLRNPHCYTAVLAEIAYAESQSNAIAFASAVTRA